MTTPKEHRQAATRNNFSKKKKINIRKQALYQSLFFLLNILPNNTAFLYEQDPKKQKFYFVMLNLLITLHSN